MLTRQSVRVATAADAVALGIELPSWCVKWGGWVYPADEPVAMGAVCWDAKDWAVCFFTACGQVPPVVAHRTAWRAMRWLRETGGARRILTVPDETKPRAAEWLRRLGFRPTETVIPGIDAALWECDVK